MRVIIFCSSKHHTIEIINRAMAEAEILGIVPTSIVSRAEFGADMSELWAHHHRLPVDVVRPNMALSPLRRITEHYERLMASADALVAIHDGRQYVAEHVIELAHEAGKPVHVVHHVPAEPRSATP